VKITILGSRGQIGSYLTNYLKDKGHYVYEFDIVNGKEEDLTKIPNPLLEERIADSDFVFFLAFDVGGSRYLKKYQHTFQFIHNNTLLMTNVFDMIKKYNSSYRTFRLDRFVVTSLFHFDFTKF
jgi:nucleoside-diphosphate-sugar epimerase